MTTPRPVEARPVRQLVIVSGAGRSGTSTVSGSLSRLGYHVPQPEVEANRSNPRGFYESRWVVDFHINLLRKGDATALDTRPEVRETLRRIGERPRLRGELRSWLEGQLEAGSLVVKDPRTVWFLDLWEETAADLGAEVKYLTMLRHPAEVVGSRDEYYGGRGTAQERAAGRIANLAGWVNCSLINERITRGRPRVFLQYTQLLGDWRAALQQVSDALGLEYASDISARKHPIDQFIDSGLRRVRGSWEDQWAPSWLQETAEESWQLLSGARGELDDPEVRAALDEVTEHYEHDFAQAIALSRDHTRAAVRRARRQTRRRVTTELSGDAATGTTKSDSAVPPGDRAGHASPEVTSAAEPRIPLLSRVKGALTLSRRPARSRR